MRELDGSIEATEFLRFITAVACRTGQMVNYSDIGGDLDGMRTEKVQAWLGLLEKSDIIFYLHPYSNNQLKRTVSKPKLYFYDCGLVAYLTRWSSPETLEAGALNGAILENYTVADETEESQVSHMDTPDEVETVTDYIRVITATLPQPISADAKATVALDMELNGHRFTYKNPIIDPLV